MDLKCPGESNMLEGLLAEGWTPRFVASGPRLTEAIELYRTLGYEVKTVPFGELGCGECTLCIEDGDESTVMIFTRETDASRATGKSETSAQ